MLETRLLLIISPYRYSAEGLEWRIGAYDFSVFLFHWYAIMLICMFIKRHL